VSLTPRPADFRGELSRKLTLGLALTLGAILRLWHLDAQVLTGDELHVVKVALAWPLDEIVSTWTYHGADYGVPMALLYRVALDIGLRLGELELRVPILAASLLSIVIMPWLLRGKLGDTGSAIFALAIATSPLLVLYGRLVRSYAPAVLFAFVAIVCFDRWRRSRSLSSAAGYCTGASLAIWFNLTSAPLVAAPMVFEFGRLALQRCRNWQEWRSVLALGACALTAVALPILPARDSLFALGEIHGGGGLPSFATWLEVVRMHAGARSPWLAWVVVGAAARGAWLMAQGSKENRSWLGLIAFAFAFHIAGLIALSPDQLDNPIVINRYLLVLLPFGLSLVAAGLAAPLPRIPRRAHYAGVLLLAGALFATGPLRPAELGTTSFANAPTYTYFVRAGNTVPRDRLPLFYAELARASDRGETQPIIEYPWFNLATHAFDAYQKHHRQTLQVAALAQSMHDDRLALANMVQPRAANYLESDARWLVVHLDLQNEERRVDTSDRNHWMRLETRPAIWEPLLVAGPAAAQALEQRWGPADFAGDGLRVWDLERIRQHSTRRRGR